jgi:quinoprotein glucose dehydrogenase
MPRTTGRSVMPLVPLGFIAALVWITVGASGLGQSNTANPVSAGTANGEWPSYTGDIRGSRYSPLSQINATNFNDLEVAWRFKTDSLGTRPEYKLEGTPLMVGGVLYTTAGTRRAVVALDAKTGELLWVHRYPEGRRGAAAPRQLSGRGLAYWTDGKGDDRILYVTPGYRLIALDAKTGMPVRSFGKEGVVDMKVGAVFGTGQQIDLETGEIGLHSTPLVVKDIVLVGSAMKEGMTVTTHNNTKGVARAYDARTGKERWTFNGIPRPGEFGNDTWLDNSWAINGNTGVWTQITVDEELGLVYLPVETPTSDYYGGKRPGNNLFAESLVCVDLQTGKRKWHFQFVHHPIWDHDMSSAPLIADVTINGKPRKVVAVPSKQAWLYVFDRVTGEPIWPIEEKPVPKGDVPGEWYAPTQPHPPAALMYGRNAINGRDDLIDFTPELRAQAIKNLDRYKWYPGVVYNPPIVGNVDGLLGAINLGNASGGTNWPGGGYDPETHIVYAQANTGAIGGESVARPAGEGRLNVQGLPILKPPYGVLAAIDLNRGRILWRVPHGDTPDVVRNHPALKGMNIPKTGQAGSVGLVITKTLVILGDPQATTLPDRPRGAMLRAYDKATGKEVGAVYMPAIQSGSPMTYMVDNRQFIVVAVSGGPYSGEYIAFSLPEEQRPTSEAGRR